MTDTFFGPPAALTELFASAEVPSRLAYAAFVRLGPGAADALRDNPWRLLRVPGIRPEQADFFAKRLLGDEAGPRDPRRVVELAAHLLLRAAGDGHTVTPVTTLLSALEAYDPGDAVEALRAAIGAGEITLAGEGTETELLGLAEFATAEETVAEGLARLTAMADPLPPVDGAPEAIFEHGVTVLTGTPAAIERTVRALADAPNVIVLAATDRAAKDAGGERSAHLTLGPGPDGYSRGVDSPLEADLVIVTEASTLDVVHAAALVEACMDGTHLVLAADPAAPSPPAAGRVLGDVIASGVIPVTALPAEDGDAIDRVAAAAREGGLVPVDPADRTVVIVPAGEAREAAHRAVQLVTDSIPRALGIPAGDVLVVTPAQRGEAGANALNQALKERLNPGPGPYDPGDRVVAATDLPTAAAGEFGDVVAAKPDEDRVDVAFDAGTVTVPGAALRHGWAVTVQRAQGTRWPAVVAVMSGEAAGVLTRPLVVGAFTRARRHLSVVHAAGPELALAVRERQEPARRTRLAELLRENLADL
ncbi:helix-hairpin-helix domain-containing protein [Actinomadura sp. DC4]|uniref:helix-hairpin-helix domain-containing protein n=1 Tax=Actinomadura sp. DC4 TaxID=3055069 RepID=UPI0025B0AE42|nr:helix-hairpin-helix domain-containing protein [Actinomadura sp. DC4]MDN3355274.1 helix-hairpin-helix domain-containing protein [Actinomadura sp. DC4]